MTADQHVSNKALGKKLISKLLNTCYRTLGLKDTVIFADQLMYPVSKRLVRCVGRYEDMVIPDAKKDEIIAQSRSRSA
jgi:DNA-directed RNA polymerase subunit beta'